MTTNKVLPVALVATLLGGTVGAFVMRENRNATPDAAQTTTAQPLTASDVSTDKTVAANDQNAALDNEIAAETRNMTDEQRAAFREGFFEGAQMARGTVLNSTSTVIPASR